MDNQSVQKKTVILTGSSGMLGSSIARELKDRYDIIGIYRNLPNRELKNQVKADLCDSGRVREIIKDINPDSLVHCAAVCDVERCEDDWAYAHNNNALAVKNVVSALDSQKRLIYISTDSIFDGIKGNYSENDFPRPLNNYAKSKLEGENFVQQYSQNFTIIRTNFFGANRVKGASLAEWVIQNLVNGKTIKMFTDVIFSPLTINTLSGLLGKLLCLDFIGKLNIGSEEPISKYNFGLKLAQLFNLDSALIVPISVDAFGFKARRPKDTSLNCAKARSLFAKLPKIEDELLRFHKEQNAYKNIKANNEN